MAMSVGVVGASGYAGAELLRLLAGHPDLGLAWAAAGSAAGGGVGGRSAPSPLLDPAPYPEWYGAEPPAPAELGAWAYGLPELHRDELTEARKVAVPGCYPTAT